MFFVVLFLNAASTVGFGNGALHTARHFVGVHNDPPLRVSGGAPYRLHERGLAPQKALLVRVENGDEAHLGKVESLAQKVDPAEHVELARTQSVDNIDTLQRIHVRMHIAHFDMIFF